MEDGPSQYFLLKMNYGRCLNLCRSINWRNSSKGRKSGNKTKWYSCFSDIRRSLGIGGTPIEVEIMEDLDVVPCVQGSVNRKRLE